MAAQLYSNTKLAESLFDVLNEMVAEGLLNEDLAVQTLSQLDQSYLSALRDHVNAKAEIKANLSTYKYLDNVWQFVLKDVSFRLNPTGVGSAKKSPEVLCDIAKVVCVEHKLAQKE
eukprot:jgi/Chrzof1/607/Cz01g22070.t1